MKATVYTIRNLLPHPTLPHLRVAMVGEHQVVIGDHYADGLLGVYIPPDAIVPEPILRELWLWNEAIGRGRLAGTRGNQVKARTMGGVLSDGLFYGSRWRDEAGTWHDSASWDPAWTEGQDVSAALGVIDGNA